VSKGFDITQRFGLELALSFGYKTVRGPGMNDNRADVDFAWSFPIAITDKSYVNPALHFSWTDLEAINIGNEYMVWGGINTGVAL
jgi:hypothetical protein